jgi:hypothetical protein
MKGLNRAILVEIHHFSHETLKYVTYETYCMFHVKTFYQFFDTFLLAFTYPIYPIYIGC